MATTDDQYEEWIAHPDKRVFVHSEDRWNYARLPGWWATERMWTDAALALAGYRPEARVRQVKPVVSGPQKQPMPPAIPQVLTSDG